MTTDTLELPPIDAALIDTPDDKTAIRADVVVAEPRQATLKETALASFTPIVAHMTTLAQRYRDVAFDLLTPKGLAAAKAARLELREEGRYAVQRLQKRLKDEANDLKRTIDAKAEEAIAIVKPVEDAIHAQIEAHEAKVAAEKAERERIEAERKAKHEAGIAKIRAYLAHCEQPGMTAARIQSGMDMLRAVTFGPEWEEYAVPAASAQCETLEAMQRLHAGAVAREEAAARAAEEAARLEAQRIENERKAAELAEREAALKRAEEEAAAREQASREQAAFEDWVNKTSPSGDVESVQRQWEASAEYHDLHGIEYRPATMATTEGKAETPGAGSAEAAPLADDWDDIPACPGCGAMAGCCQDFPNCPGGQAATSQPAPGGSPAKTSEVNDDDESDRGRARRLAGAGDEDSVGPDRRADDSARDDGASVHDAGLLRSLAHGDPRQGDAEHAGLTSAPSEAALQQAADFELRTDPPPPAPASDTAHATDIEARVILLQEPEPEPIDALLLDCLALVNHAAKAFEGRFPSHSKPEQAWWAELRERINSVRPGLLAMTGEGA